MSLRPSRPGDAESDLHRAIARLSVTDIERLGATRGYRRGGSAQDEDAQLALRMAIDEARALETIQQDRELALSMQDGDGEPHTPVSTRTSALQPHPATFIRGSASASSTARVPASASPTQAHAVTHNRLQPHPISFIRAPAQAAPPSAGAGPVHVQRPTAQPEKTGGIFGFIGWLFGLTDASSSQPSATRTIQSTTNRSQNVSNRLTGHDCVTCMDAIRGVEIRTPCGHYYDKECMLQLFEAATKDESLFPPRCCRQPIPLQSVSMHMSTAAIATFNEKSREFGTRKRVYCAKPSCSRFLGAQHEGFFRASPLRCPAPGCGTLTCPSCKNAVQAGASHKCDTSDADRGVLALGQQSGWARCPGCETMIELNLGCYHMTCRCRTEFCYVCKARWKTCSCPQWDERRLLAAAEARADAQIRFGGVGAQEAPPLPVRRDAPAPVLARVVRAPAPAPVPARAPTLPPRRNAAPTAPNVRPTHGPAAHSNPTSTTSIRTSATVRATSATTTSATSTSSRPPSGDSRPRNATNESSSSSIRHHTSKVMTESSSRRYFVTDEQREDSEATLRRNRAAVNLTFHTHQSATEEVSTSRNPFREAKSTRDALVRQWMDRLRVDHDCDHGAWAYRKGAGTCEVCHDRLPFYLFSCKGCAIMACRRCRWNRL